ncbi:MAG TPA: MFS transporter [Trebonia sp.]|nr:MFS transporter [Trebonia sp.]
MSQRREGGGQVVSRALLVTLLVATVAALPVFLVGTLALQIRASLRFGTAALGLTVAGFYLGAAVSSVPAARAAERIGGIRVMRLCTLAVAMLLACIGAFARSWWLLTALLAFAGVMSGSSAPAQNLFLARRIPAERQGAAFGIKQAAVPFANLLGGVAVPAVGLTIGWRWAFGLAALLAAGAVAFMPKPAVPLAQRRGQAAPGPVWLPPLAFFAAGLGLGMFAASGLTAFAVLAAAQVGFGKSAAGLLAALGGAAAVAARVSVGFYADRSRRDRFAVAASMVTVGAAGFAALAASMRVESRWLYIVGIVLALGAGWGWNGLFNYAVVASYRDAPARATGITQVGGRLGGVLGPFVVGLVAQQLSYSAAWLVAGVAALAAAGSMLAGGHLLNARARGRPG